MNRNERARELQDIVEMIWLTMLGIPIDCLPASANGVLKGDCLTHVAIRGSWDGSLRLGCSMGLARFIGAALFQRDPWDLDEASSVAAVLELTNMIGGNVKALVGPGSHLGSAEIRSKENAADSCGDGLSLLFDCLGEPLSLQLVREEI